MGRKCKNYAAELISRIGSKVTARLDNVTIYRKFILILLACVLMPIILSCVAFSVLTANYVNNTNEANLQGTSESVLAALQNVFDEAVAVTNTVAANQDITSLSEVRFKNELDYYMYAEDNNLIRYAEEFITLRDYVDSVEIYLNNDTLSNGGVIRRIDDDVRDEKWYKAAEASSGIISVIVNDKPAAFRAPDDGTGTKTPMSFVRRITSGVTGGKTLGYVKVDVNLDRLAYIMRRPESRIEFYLINYKEDTVYDAVEKKLIYGAEEFKETKRKGYINLESDFGSVNYMKQWTLFGSYNNKGSGVERLYTIAMIIAINLLVGLFMMLIVILIYKSFSHRINVMMESMREAEEGEFKEIRMDAGGDELGALTRTYNHMVARIGTLINDVYKLEINNKTIEAERARAELNFLQSQVNPHFIFNVLNAMLVVSVKNGYTDLSEQISGLAKMFRRLLDWSEEYEPLSTEMSFIETYLKLEKFRFGEAFCYNISMAPEAGECGIPKMIVQPLVENACKHGLRGVVGKRRLDVSAELDNGVLTIAIWDNGTGITPQKLKELVEGLSSGDFDGHIGLKNVYKRLKIYFGDSAELIIKSEPEEGTTVTIRIDYGKEDPHVQGSDS